MFTGIVQRTAPIVDVREVRGGRRITIGIVEEPRFPPWPEIERGESISVSGVCLTATHLASRGSERSISFDAVPETIERSSLGRKRAGDRVNLERSLRAGDLLGGHYVTGHIDATGHVVGREPRGSQVLFRIGVGASSSALGQVIPKGSVAVDGISLTVVDVDRAEGWFSFAVVPFTLQWTTLGEAQPGTEVNIETDAFGKWVLHGLQSALSGEKQEEARWRELLDRLGPGARGGGWESS